ncbi:MAG: metallophosphoesterase family protein [Acidimicrobiales bacterium]
MRIGLVADTHDAICDWPAVLSRIVAALGDVDLVLHCGDITTTAALDDLESIAPVRASRSAGDPPPDPPRLDDGPRVIEVGGFAVGLAFVRPEGPPAEVFGCRVDAVVCGGTHTASVEEVDGLLYVNPGSPSLSKTPTVAVLVLGEGMAPTAEVVPV